MRAKYLALCVTCGVLAGLLYYVYLLAITPVVNGMVDGMTYAIDKISEQDTTSAVERLLEQDTTSNTDTTTSNTDSESSD